jgi:hypothetical protein
LGLGASTGFGLEVLADLTLGCAAAAVFDAYDVEGCVAGRKRLVTCSGIELLKAERDRLEVGPTTCMWLEDVEG